MNPSARTLKKLGRDFAIGALGYVLTFATAYFAGKGIDPTLAAVGPVVSLGIYRTVRGLLGYEPGDPPAPVATGDKPSAS